MLVDDFAGSGFVSALGTEWRTVTDTVMGGRSQASLRYDHVDGLRCLRLSGQVRLDNNGGFLQMALDLGVAGGTLDASKFNCLRLLVRGNGERYSAHLRTPDNLRPWQSYRAHFTALSRWCEIRLPLDGFQPHRVDATLDVSRLKRLGLVAIGRAFQADLAVAEIRFAS